MTLMNIVAAPSSNTMANLLSVDALGSLISLAALETVLGIDNIIFLSILVGKLPKHQQPLARRLGLIGALGMRILLLLTLTWIAGMSKPIFHVLEHPVSGRDLVMIVGGTFLVFKSTWEIFGGLEAEDPREEKASEEETKGKGHGFLLALLQIIVMDIVFSLDSVITAVGIAPSLTIMIAAMVLSMFVMMLFAGAVGDFVNRHPSMKVLALSFLILIGTLLVAEGGGQHINKGYIYASMAFAFSVELMNIWLRKRATKAVELNTITRHASRASLPPGTITPITDAERIHLLEQQIAEQQQRIVELEARAS